jgi:hypothetical protein
LTRKSATKPASPWAADADAEIRRDARDGGGAMPDRRRSERGEQSRLARLQAAVADSGRGGGGERLARRLGDGEPGEPGSQSQEGYRGDRA